MSTNTIRRLTIKGKGGETMIVDAPAKFVAVLVRDNPDGSGVSEMIGESFATAWLRENSVLTEYQSEPLDKRTEYVTGYDGRNEVKWVELEGEVNSAPVRAVFCLDPDEEPTGWTLNRLEVDGLPAIDNTEVARAIAARNGIDW